MPLFSHVDLEVLNTKIVKVIYDLLLKLPLLLRILTIYTFMTFPCMTRNNRAIGMEGGGCIVKISDPL